MNSPADLLEAVVSGEITIADKKLEALHVQVEDWRATESKRDQAISVGWSLANFPKEWFVGFLPGLEPKGFVSGNWPLEDKVFLGSWISLLAVVAAVSIWAQFYTGELLWGPSGGGQVALIAGAGVFLTAVFSVVLSSPFSAPTDSRALAIWRKSLMGVLQRKEGILARTVLNEIERFKSATFEQPIPTILYEKAKRDLHLFDNVYIASPRREDFEVTLRPVIDPMLLGIIGEQWFVGGIWDLSEDIVLS